MTLETLCRIENALSHEILVTPDDYEEWLLDNRARLLVVVKAAAVQFPDFLQNLQEVVKETKVEIKNLPAEGASKILGKRPSAEAPVRRQHS